MSDETGLENADLIDLFRSEVETHSESLSAALLALERDPTDTSRFDEMMRAAHSIKGASRIVGVDPAVGVAHAMEDCFVAAQKGTIAFSSGDVDVLLRGVDLLGKISAATQDPNANLALQFDGPVRTLVVELQDVLNGRARSGASPREGGGSPSAASPAVAATVAAGTHPTPSGTSPARDVTIAFPEVLDAVAAEAIRRELLLAIESRCATIRFDMRATRDLDVQGLAFLAAVPPHLARHSLSSLHLAGVSPEMATVFRVTGLEGAFGGRGGAVRGAE